MSEPQILRQAEFDPRVKSYWIWGPVVTFTLLIVTIPIAILYAIIARLLIDKYLANMSCTLTERTLDIKKGILNKTESTIPLEKITDLQLFQGPVMRYFGLHGFKVETAGQSSPGGGSLVNIVGIVDTKDFRKAVLDQRDRMASRAGSIQGGAGEHLPSPASNDPETSELLTDIRDSLLRIERGLADQSSP